MPISVVEQYYQMMQHLDISDKMQIVAQLQKDIEQNQEIDMSQYPKLSRLTAHPNFVNGNSDDLVNISWEKELNLDFPE